jgi:hypothetical protein
MSSPARSGRSNLPAHCARCAGKPGSVDAIARGCTCPVLSNGHGHANPDWTWVTAGCPVHCPSEVAED